MFEVYEDNCDLNYPSRFCGTRMECLRWIKLNEEGFSGSLRIRVDAQVALFFEL